MSEILQLAEAISRLLKADNILLLCHKNPDGDTVGSAMALCHVLKSLGKTAAVLCADPIPSRYAYMQLCLFEEGDFEPHFVVAVDVAGIQLFGDSETVQKYAQRVDLCIDHHTSNSGYAASLLLDGEAAATAELMYDMFSEMGAPITPLVADCLYTGLSTDTGCFQYSNTTADTHRVAAALMDTGIDVFPLNKRHFRTKSWARLQVERLLTERMHRYEGGKIAVAPVSLSLMDEAGATEEDMEDIAAFLGQIEGVETSVTIRELAAQRQTGD